MTTRRMQLDSIPPPPTKFGEGFKCMLQATPEMSLAWTVKDEYIYFQQQLLGPGGWYVRSTPPLVPPPHASTLPPCCSIHSGRARGGGGVLEVAISYINVIYADVTCSTLMTHA